MLVKSKTWSDSREPLRTQIALAAEKRCEDARQIMIRYALRCPTDHRFEGWFPNSGSFDDQCRAGTLRCPMCGDTKILKAPMAPSVTRGRSDAGTVDPMQVLRALRSMVEATCDNVGGNFAEEARKIHYGEIEPHGIYGDATQDEAAELAEEGIDIAALPWVPLPDG